MGVMTRRRAARVTRRTLDQMIRRGKLSRDDADAVRKVLKHDDLFGLTRDRVRNMAEDSATEIGMTADEADDNSELDDFPLLKWLWEQREEILAFVLKIVGLFLKVNK